MLNFEQIIMRNKKTKRIADTIARVRKMEQYFDEILEVMKIGQNILMEDEEIHKKFQDLVTYYENGQWLQDYECDERGELPGDLKRGVLSEDGLYNLLSDIENMKIESYEEL